MIFKPDKISDFADEKHTCFFLIDLVNDCVFLCVINLSYFFFSPLELTQNNIKLSPTLLKTFPLKFLSIGLANMHFGTYTAYPAWLTAQVYMKMHSKTLKLDQILTPF